MQRIFHSASTVVALAVPLAVVALAVPLAVIAGCASKPAPPTPTPRPVAVVNPAPLPSPAASDWRDWPTTSSGWVYRQDARGSIALFGPVGGDARLTLRCDRAAGAIYLSRQGDVTAPLTLRTTSATRVLPVRLSGPMQTAEPLYAVVALAPRDPLLDAIAFSRGRFVVEQAGAETLVVPAWAEIARVTEDCRR